MRTQKPIHTRVISATLWELSSDTEKDSILQRELESGFKRAEIERDRIGALLPDTIVHRIGIYYNRPNPNEIWFYLFDTEDTMA